MNWSFINAFVSIITIAGLLAAALGWRHSLRSPYYSPEWFFAMAKVLMALGLSIRLLLWDVLWGLLMASDRATALDLSEFLGATNVNVVSSAIVLVGVYCSLKARQLILLQDRNVDWHWIIAWAYPGGKTIVRIIPLSKRGRNRDN